MVIRGRRCCGMVSRIWDVAIAMDLIYRPEGRLNWRDTSPPGYLRPPPVDTS